MLTKLIDKFDASTTKLSKKLRVEDHEDLLGYCIGVVLCFMIWIFLATNSLGVSILVGMALSTAVFYFMFFRIIRSFEEQITELKRRVCELEINESQQETSNNDKE